MEEGRQYSVQDQRAWLAQHVADVFFAESLFDSMGDIVFFVKDTAGRYIVVNQTLVRRCGLREKSALLGRSAADLFPTSLAVSYATQDAMVLKGAKELRDQLELHLYPNRSPGWCLTQKKPLRDQAGAIIGLCGVSRDLAAPDQRHPVYAKVAAAVSHLHQHYAQTVSMAELVELTGLSVAQLERNFHKIFSLTPRQMMVKIRLDAASAMLSASDCSITEVALACGYQDHSAFSRVFRATVGMTPSDYREVMRDSQPAN
ncbi:AraC family transcriptional regulator [Undibacterium sp. CY22W]|uniref:AraC family transcriptional regulator n=2 Tax=Undibacterium curvum TaxID=2762294 RepID=A0ABR7A548_9BURK|nr:AraC family transcriptional regulator [Undibacterium curvum]